jgi:hypothetical protein
MGKKSIILFSMTLVLLAITNCAQQKVTPYRKLYNYSDKSITVPAGGELNGYLKSELQKSGWKLKIDSTSLATKGKNTEKIDEVAKIEFDTSYRMLTDYKYRYCFSCDCVSYYNISIIDNKTGEEVVVFDGRNDDGLCNEDVARRVVDWMHRN